MKKIILLALLAIMMVGCTSVDNQNISRKIVVLDSCEYIQYWAGNYCTCIEHKGNCRFCKERREQEFKELVEQLKDK